MKIIKITSVSALLVIGVSAHADFLGTLSGRSANPANNPPLSVEGSFTTGSDYQNIGARVNYSVNESLTVYGDFGLIDFDGPDGNGFGAGLFYYLPNLSDSIAFFSDKDVAVQANYHSASLDIGGDFGDFGDVDVSSLGVALLVSPKEAFNPDNGMNWYANAGLTRVTRELKEEFVDFDQLGNFQDTVISVSDSEIEIQIGGGIYLPAGSGTLYAGIDIIDEFIIGAGYRLGID